MSYMSNIRVTLKDADTNKTYDIFVSAEESELLSTDIFFATKKLREAIALEDARELLSRHNQSSNNIIQRDSLPVGHDFNQTKHDELINEKDSMHNQTVDDEITDDEIAEDGVADNALGAFRWPHKAILMLIDLYRLHREDFYSGKITQKKTWKKIEEELIKNGHKVTLDQCISKFSGLKKTYKVIKDHQNKSGNGTRRWAYFELMNELLKDKPFMDPVATISSTGKRTSLTSSSTSGKRTPLTSSSTSGHNSPNLNTSDSEDDSDPTPKSKKRRLSSGETLLKTIAKLRNESEERMEKRHQENLEMKRSLLESFDKFINKNS